MGDGEGCVRVGAAHARHGVVLVEEVGGGEAGAAPDEAKEGAAEGGET